MFQRSAFLSLPSTEIACASPYPGFCPLFQGWASGSPLYGLCYPTDALEHDLKTHLLLIIMKNWTTNENPILCDWINEGQTVSRVEYSRAIKHNYIEIHLLTWEHGCVKMVRTGPGRQPSEIVTEWPLSGYLIGFFFIRFCQVTQQAWTLFHNY